MSLSNYTKKCKGVIGGLKRVYLCLYEYYDETEIFIVNGELEEFPSGQVLLPFEVISSYTQQSGEEGGVIFWDQTIAVKLTDVYNILNPEIFVQNRFRLVALTNNDEYLMFGLFNGLDCLPNNSSGTEKAEFNGFELNFTGKEMDHAPIVDITDFIISTSISSKFNYTLNFDI